MGHRYHTLISRQDGQWAIEFGDYSRRTVQDELEDMVGGYMDIKRSNLRIITTSDDQASIEAAVAELNRR